MGFGFVLDELCCFGICCLGGWFCLFVCFMIVCSLVLCFLLSGGWVVCFSVVVWFVLGGFGWVVLGLGLCVWWLDLGGCDLFCCGWVLWCWSLGCWA